MSSEHEKLENLIRDGVVSLYVEETPWGERVVKLNYDDDGGGKYGITEEQHEQIEKLLDKYEDLVIEISSVNNTYDGIERAWEIGRLVDENVENGSLTNGQFSMLAQVGQSGEGTYISQFHEIFEAFPEKGFSEEHFTPSYLAELMHTVDHETAQEINKNAIEQDIRMRKAELRAVRDAYGTDSIPEAVKNAVERNAFDEYASEELAQIITNSLNLLGREIRKEDVRELVEEERP